MQNDLKYGMKIWMERAVFVLEKSINDGVKVEREITNLYVLMKLIEILKK